MKIVLRAMFKPDVLKIVESDPDLSLALKPDGIVYVLDANSHLFDLFIEKTKQTQGCWFNPYMEFSKQEIESVSCYQLQCRGKVLKPSPKDDEINHARMQSSNFIFTDASIKIQLISNLSISKINMIENSVARASEWLDEYVISKDVLETFEHEALTGVKGVPITGSKSGSKNGLYFQIFSNSIMPIAQLNITTLKNKMFISGVEEYSFRQLGCLVYQSMACENINDFNRTAENWSSNYFPSWVVSSKTRHCCEKYNIKGWKFLPVLETGTALYERYIGMWSRLFDKIGINPLNKIS